MEMIIITITFHNPFYSNPVGPDVFWNLEFLRFLKYHIPYIMCKVGEHHVAQHVDISTAKCVTVHIVCFVLFSKSIHCTSPG